MTGENTPPQRLNPLAGTSINNAAHEACALAQKTGRDVGMSFNGVELLITSASTPASVVEEWHQKQAEAMDAYWTPERLHEKASREDAERAATSKLMEDLPRLDVQNLDACILWLCRLEKVTTIHTTEAVRPAVILQHFARGGLTPGMEVNDRGETPEAWASRVGKVGRKRWLIGQALDGIA